MTRSVVDAPPGGSPAPPAPDRPRRHVWGVVGIVVASALGVAAVAMSFIRVPYVITSPGDATPLGRDVVSITGAETYPHDDDLRFLTVRVSNTDPNVWRYLFAQLDDEVSVDEREAVIGCQSYEESARLNDVLMQESQDAATTVALTHLGYTVTPTGSRALVRDVVCDGPSRGHLRAGDVITAIEGTPVSTSEEIRPLVVAHRPGERLEVTVDRGGDSLDIRVELGERDGAAFMGITTQTTVDEQYPIDVRIDTRRVSGPSAGLAFTLAIIDELTPGDLTGPNRVAVTGSILPDGTVTPVGGVPQKAVTARDSGATLMLVPKGEAKSAREHAGTMKVVTVATIADALRALRRAGGAPVPEVAPGTSGLT